MKALRAPVLFGLSLLLTTASAHAQCPTKLAQLKTTGLPAELKNLCELHDRYQAAKAVIAAQVGEANAFRLRDAIAPRLIEMDTWLAALGDGYTSPWRVYKKQGDPKADTITWERFQKAATLVENESLASYRAGKLAPLDRDRLLAIHWAALGGGLFESAGSFRIGDMDFLAQVNRRWSLTQTEVNQLRNIEYTYQGTDHKLATWSPVVCIEDMDAKAVEKLKKHGISEPGSYIAIPAEQFFTGDDGQPRQCGYYGYAKGGKIKGLVSEFLAEINQRFEQYNSGDPTVDPLRLASRAQRWYVTIHPHDDGNGRTSRFIMDGILLSMGLPAPILPEMGHDIFISEIEWASHIGQGMLRTLKIFESCAKNLAQPACAIVPETPPAGK